MMTDEMTDGPTFRSLMVIVKVFEFDYDRCKILVSTMFRDQSQTFIVKFISEGCASFIHRY